MRARIRSNFEVRQICLRSWSLRGAECPPCTCIPVTIFPSPHIALLYDNPPMPTRFAPRLAAHAIEILEARVAPAGLITATFVGGVLTLTGDNLDNVVNLEAPGQITFRLTGFNGTTIALNGAPAAAVVLLDGAVTSLKAQLAAAMTSSP
jgi:hypothetical protein